MKTIFGIFISLVLLMSVTKVWAKDPAESKEKEKPAAQGWKFTVESVGAAQSFYTPNMGYWNTVSEIRNWDTKFQSMRLWGGNVEFGLYNHLHLRAEGSYASGTARQTVVPTELGGGTQSKTISLVPVSAIFLWEFRDEDVIPYVGAGAGTVFENSTSEKKLLVGDSGTAKTSSTDYMYYAVGGVKFPATKNLFLGVEAKGAFGSYQEMVSDTHHVSSLQTISLNGFQIGVTVNYRF